MLTKRIIAATAVVFFAGSVGAQALFSDDFSSDTTGAWTAAADAVAEGNILYSAAGGNPGGAINFTATNPGGGAGKAYIFNLDPIDVTGLSTVTVSFEAKLDSLVESAVHLLGNFDAAPFIDHRFDIQGSIPGGSYAPLSFDLTVPAGATSYTLAFQIASSPNAGSGGSLFVDNLAIVPEPSVVSALIGLLACGCVLGRRRR